MDAPDFFAALYAASCSVRDGDVDEVEVVFESSMIDCDQTLTVIVRRFDHPSEVEEDAEGVSE